MSSTRIAESLRKRILSGDLPSGASVPSAREITRTFKVAIATASKALAMLKEEGLVRAIPGVGTVVDQGLSRDRIVAVGLEIADGEGIEAVSMRRIGLELRVAPMSLYRYVRTKDELLLLLADAAYAQDLPRPNVRAPWRQRLDESARLQWKIYRKHPWLAAGMQITRPQLVPNGMAHTDAMMAALEGVVELEPAMILTITLANFVRGIAIGIEMETRAEQDSGLTNDAYMQAQQTRFDALFSSGRFPALAKVAALPDIDVTLDRLFEFGLLRILDGFERFVRPGRADIRRKVR